MYVLAANATLLFWDTSNSINGLAGCHWTRRRSVPALESYMLTPFDTASCPFVVGERAAWQRAAWHAGMHGMQRVCDRAPMALVGAAAAREAGGGTRGVAFTGQSMLPDSFS